MDLAAVHVTYSNSPNWLEFALITAAVHASECSLPYGRPRESLFKCSAVDWTTQD
jgi:hypothetical protein